MRSLYHILLALIMFGQKLAQTPAAQSERPTPPVLNITSPEQPPQDEYLLPVERRLQVRDLQYKLDQNEIKIQKMQVQIEQLKEEQVQWLNDISVIATDFAKVKQIDPDRYELDGSGVRLVRKKPKPGANIPPQGSPTPEPGRKP